MTAPDLGDRLKDRLEALVEHLLPAGRRDGRTWRVGSAAGEPGSSLSIVLRGDQRGAWRDWATGEAGGPIQLIQAVRGCDRAAAVAWARDWLGDRVAPSASAVAAVRRPRRPRRGGEDHPEAPMIARRLWDEARPIEGTPGEMYFRGRGIPIALPPTLRFHPALPHRSGHVGPGVVAIVEDVAGDMLGVWRIWVRPDGTGKADVTPARMGMGPVAGGAVRLGPPADVLGIAEGIEEAAAVTAQTGGWISCWAGLSTSGMQSVRLPEHVGRPILYANNDGWRRDSAGRAYRPGTRAAEAAARRLIAEGRSPRILYPTGYADWNDRLIGRSLIEVE